MYNKPLKNGVSPPDGCRICVNGDRSPVPSFGSAHAPCRLGISFRQGNGVSPAHAQKDPLSGHDRPVSSERNRRSGRGSPHGTAGSQGPVRSGNCLQSGGISTPYTKKPSIFWIIIPDFMPSLPEGCCWDFVPCGKVTLPSLTRQKIKEVIQMRQGI